MKLRGVCWWGATCGIRDERDVHNYIYIRRKRPSTIAAVLSRSYVAHFVKDKKKILFFPFKKEINFKTRDVVFWLNENNILFSFDRFVCVRERQREKSPWANDDDYRFCHVSIVRFFYYIMSPPPLPNRLLPSLIGFSLRTWDKKKRTNMCLCTWKEKKIVN